MSERSVKCPDCTFSFAHLVDAGDYRAYVCMACGWSKPTSDTRPGNRPADVCALCDHAIDLTGDVVDLHKYFGEDWVWGAGSRCAHIPIHRTCAEAIRAYERTGTLWTDGCSCPPAWVKAWGGLHMRNCQLEVA